MLNKKYYNKSIEQMSENIITHTPFIEKFINIYRREKRRLEGFLMNEDLAPICAILDTLRDELTSFSDLELEILRYKWLLPCLSEEPELLIKYYYEGLMKIYDPFRSASEYFMDKLGKEDKRPSICSELLINPLRELLSRGEEMLIKLKVYWEKGIESKCRDDISRTLFLEKLSDSVKSKGKEDIEIKKSFEKTLGYFDKIIPKYEDIQDKPELTWNPLQSLDFVFKKLLELQLHNPSLSVEDCFKIFRLDQGCVLTNYLALCSKLTGIAWDIDVSQLAGFLEKQRAETLGFVKNPMFEIITAFDDFLRVKEYRLSDSKEKRDLDDANLIISKNMDSFFKFVRHKCVQTYYTNKPLDASIRYAPVEDILSKSNKNPGKFDLGMDEAPICESMLDYLEKIVGSPRGKGALENFCKVLIKECFDTHYENSKKLAAVSTLVESGAQSILSTVIKKLKEEMNDKRNEEEVELLNHLIVIGELIDKLLAYSKDYRYLEILNRYYRDMSSVSSEVRAIKGKDGNFGEHVSYIREALNKKHEKCSNSTGEGGLSDDDSGSLKKSDSFKMEKIYR